jgi:HSP20 family molecular chaperone IbpA
MSLFGRKKIDSPDDDFPLAIKAEQLEKSKAEAKEADDSYEGQLAVDVYQDKGNIIIKSTIAGVRPQDLDVAITNDTVTIRGKRELETRVEEQDFFFQECYWGGFSRSIILPCEVRADRSVASLKAGVLTITLPKTSGGDAVPVHVRSED